MTYPWQKVDASYISAQNSWQISASVDGWQHYQQWSWQNILNLGTIINTLITSIIINHLKSNIYSRLTIINQAVNWLKGKNAYVVTTWCIYSKYAISKFLPNGFAVTKIVIKIVSYCLLHSWALMNFFSIVWTLWKLIIIIHVHCIIIIHVHWLYHTTKKHKVLSTKL